MVYVRETNKDRKTIIATSEDFIQWTVRGEMKGTSGEIAVVVPHIEEEGNTMCYYGDRILSVAFSKDLINWGNAKKLVSSRGGHFDHSPLSPLGISVIKEGILVIYDTSYKKPSGYQFIKIGAVLFSATKPDEILWRSSVPIWQQSIVASDYERPIGAVFGKSKILLYFLSNEKGILTVSVPVPKFTTEGPEKKKLVVKKEKPPIQLNKYHRNPIIEPHSKNHWENEAVFNPATVYDDGKVHMLYRAIGAAGFSFLGYAASKDGYDFSERYNDPAYWPRLDFEGVRTKPTKRTDLFMSGAGWGGCEDPKLTLMEGKVYLTYVAYDGYRPPRVAISEISRENFLKQNWDWTLPELMSEPGIINKSACILPEKINGKYVVFHRVYPNILIDFVDDLEFGPDKKWLMGRYSIRPRVGMWDSRKISVGAPPIRTKDGWLVIYHAVDDADDTKYKIGAMILDINDPTKVLHRTHSPILSPDDWYENDGKPGVAYPCGAVIIENTLFVYYGGADRVVCVATAPVDEFLFNVRHEIDFKMDPKKVMVN